MIQFTRAKKYNDRLLAKTQVPALFDLAIHIKSPGCKKKKKKRVKMRVQYLLQIMNNIFLN